MFGALVCTGMFIEVYSKIIYNGYMNVKKLNTSLFIVNDYVLQLGLLSKVLSYYCGLLYYRIDWLGEDVISAMNKPLQRSLLRKAVVLVMSMDEEQVEDAVWMYVRLPLAGMLSSVQLHEVEVELKEMVAEIVASVSSAELLECELCNASIVDEEEESLAGIKAEIEKLDRDFAPMLS